MWPLQARLATGLWHTTHPKHLGSIMEVGLKSEPDIPDRERWKTSGGPDTYPFVRKLGGVSLFDFSAFDPEAYSQSHPLSNWSAFVPHRRDWGEAAWLEIDHDAISDRFISTGELVRLWNDGGHFRHTFMPRIECACIGDIPASAFKSAFVTWDGGDEVREIAIEDFSKPDYDRIMDEWRGRVRQQQ